jgi:hypothetical protein
LQMPPRRSIAATLPGYDCPSPFDTRLISKRTPLKAVSRACLLSNLADLLTPRAVRTEVCEGRPSRPPQETPFCFIHSQEPATEFRRHHGLVTPGHRDIPEPRHRRSPDP